MKKVIVVFAIGVLFFMLAAVMQENVSAAPDFLGITPTPNEPKPTPPPTSPPRDPEPKLPKTGQLPDFLWAPDQYSNVSGLSAFSQRPVTKISIPSLNMESKVQAVPFVKNTWNIDDLKLDVGWMENTALPDQVGNVVMAGHLNLLGYGRGPFVNLSKIQNGATISLYTEQFRYLYQVSTKKVVPETDLSVVAPSTTARLTLITCNTWNAVREEYQNRLVVVANLISVKPLLKYWHTAY